MKPQTAFFDSDVGQTRANRSFLLTTSLGLDSNTIKVSKVRAPTSTAAPSLVRSLSLTLRLNGPNETTSLAWGPALNMASSLQPPEPAPS
jgi:hypothetical protein